MPSPKDRSLGVKYVIYYFHSLISCGLFQGSEGNAIDLVFKDCMERYEKGSEDGPNV